MKETETHEDDFLKIEEPVDFEMSNSEIYSMINQSLKPENWTNAELLHGKKVNIFPEWKKQMQDIVHEYRDVGWKLFWFLDNGEQYLLFENPWQKKR